MLQNQAISYFSEHLPARPRCANDPASDNRIRVKSRACQYRLIEPNTAGTLRWLTFDVDTSTAAFDWYDQHVPAPSIVCQNPDNGHAHLLYALSAPVCRTSAARIKPLQYAEMIEHSLRTALQADKGYSGNLVKNPLCGYWRVTEWQHAPYSLDELADSLVMVPRTRRAANDDIAGLGRNCETFERLRTHAYKAVREFWGPEGEARFHSHLLDVAETINGTFPVPMTPAEVRGIARSVGRWVWARFDRNAFRAIQSRRGAMKGAKRKAELLPRVIAMRSAGHSPRVIGETLGINHQTVRNWLKGLRDD